MRYICAALLVLVSSVSSASAQGASTTFEPEPVRQLALTLQALAGAESRLSADHVLARMMTFDSDRDGRVTVSELSERMQGLVARGDKSGDGALDESEIRLLATAKQFAVRSLQGGYGFGDTTGLSSRNHIENSIDDLRLAPDTSREAKRIAVAFVEEFQAAAAANLRKALAPVIPAQQLAQLEASLTRANGVRTVVLTSANGTRSVAVANSATAVSMSPVREPLSSEQLGAVTAAADAFRAGQQLDDARRSELVMRLGGLLTDEQGEDLLAALARRPLVKGSGSSLAQLMPAGRTLQLTAQPAVR